MKNKEQENKIRNSLSITIKILMIIQIIIAIVFIIRNMKYVPEYGDTGEYIELAETMKLDAYRPFIYPFFLKMCINIAKVIHIDYMSIVYIIQNLFSLLSCFAIIKALSYALNKKLKKANEALYSLYLWSVPFNIHFNMTILGDSLATSFNIIFLAMLIFYLKEPKIRYLVVTIVAMFLTSNIRSEKIYFFMALLIAVIIFQIILKIKKKESNTKLMIGTTIILVIGSMTSLLAKNLFQTETEGREQPSVSLMVYERIVADNLAKYYEQLPDDVKQAISKGEAEESVVHPNNYKKVYSKLYELDGNTKRINEIIKTILKLNYSDLVKDISCDFFKNIFPIYFQLFENDERTIDWTVTRMQGEHMLYTNMYIMYYTILFIILNIILIIKLLYHKFNFSIVKLKKLMPCMLYIIISSGFFSCFTAFNFHIRYVMPIYMIETTFIVMLLEKDKINFTTMKTK